MTTISLPNNGVTVSLFLTASAQDVADLVVLTDGGSNTYKVLLKAGPVVSASAVGFETNGPAPAPVGRFHAYVSIFDYGGGSTEFDIVVNGGSLIDGSRGGNNLDATLINTLLVHPLVESVAIWSHTQPNAPLMSASDITALAGGADPSTVHPAQLIYSTGGVVVPPARWAGSLRGVQAQFDEGGATWQPDTVGQLIAAGIAPDFIRFNITRSHNTGGDASFAFSSATFDADMGPYLAAMQAASIRHTCTLWDGGGTWAGNIPDYVAWTVDMLLHHVATYPGVLALVEIWNEPNGTHWPIANAEYLQLVQALVPAVRAHAELDGISISGGVTAGVDMGYLQPLIDGGMLDLVDVVSVHKYAPAESLEAVLPPLEAAIAAAGKSTKIYLSEWGATDDPSEVSRRLTLLKTHPSILAASYFPAKDYTAFPSAGLLTSAGAVKPAGTAWGEWWTRIGADAAFVARDDLGNPNAYSLKFTKEGATVRHLWATIDTDILIDGVRTTLTTQGMYLDGDHTVTSLGGEAFLADYAADFKGVQGQPWEYGSYDTAGTWTPADWNPDLQRWVMTDIGQFHFLVYNAMHPHPDWWVSARIKFPDAHRVRVTGWYRYGESGDGVDLAIDLSDGTSIATGHLAPSAIDSSADLDFVVDLSADTYISFKLNPGPAGDNSFDITETGFTLVETTAALTVLPLVYSGGGDGGGGGGTGAVNLAFGTAGQLVNITLADGTVLWSAS